jgi:bacteriocin-like protein
MNTQETRSDVLPSEVEVELSDSELENVIGGNATTFHVNTQRSDPYKSFRFHL